MARAQDRTFTDGAGRQIDVPQHIERVFAAGSPAATTLYTLAPQMLLGWTAPLSDAEKAFLPARYAALPVLGRLTGRANTANVETVLAARPDIILDLGDVDPTHVSLAERTQEQTGLPYLIFDGSFDKTPELYEALGRLLGTEKEAAELADYARRTLDEVKEGMARLPAARRPRVYYARGPDGLETALDGSINTEMLRYVGAENVARSPDRHNTATASPEQILAWDPDVVITMDERFYHAIWDHPLWRGIKAVRDHRVYLLPRLPFGWFDSPPAVNRLIGVRFLAATLYPDVFPRDLRETTSEFYRLFYHEKLSEAQLDQLLKP
ncbi:MAG TPA: iron ABC transporter substrate-binding protein [Stellaceae bacterium]|nr:iron ABC transporter substrate-binding protein [Stellaceae bacterium]